MHSPTMYRIVCVLLIFSLLVHAQEAPPAPLDWFGTMMRCLDEQGISVSCAIGCGMQAMGVMDSRGIVNVSQALNNVPLMPLRETIGAMLDNCSTPVPQDPCDSGDDFTSCLGRGQPLRFGWDAMAVRVETIFTHSRSRS